jgi:uncharacterized protein
MFAEARQKQVFEYVKKYFRENKPDQLHDIDHIARVCFWVELLSKKESADPSITIPAAILHDIGIPKHGDEQHARKGAEMCKPVLKDFGYTDGEIEKIAQTISMHSTDDPNPPTTIEGRVLFDADKLDAFGPVGLHRWFFEYAKRGYLHREVLEKILQHIQKWKTRYGDPPFFTKTGKEIGKDKVKYIEDLCKEILRDLDKFADFYRLI